MTRPTTTRRITLRLTERRYARMRIYESWLLKIRRSPHASARELRDMARRALEEAGGQR